MLPLELEKAIKKSLLSGQRPNDGLLHSSTDLVGSLRHTQLRLANAPQIGDDFVSQVRLMTGTFWHQYVGDVLDGMPVMQEIRLNRGMPDGWGGTADWLFWDETNRAFILGDLKTVRGEGMRWIEREGAKEEHVWQLSSYYWALHELRYPLVQGFAIAYMPITTADTPLSINVQWVTPLEQDVVLERMRSRKAAVDAYLKMVDTEGLVNDALAPEREREQKLLWNKTRQVFDVKLFPHWLSKFCPFPDEFCSCNQQSIEKVGEYDLDGQYIPRKNYEHIKPTVVPDPVRELGRRRNEQEGV